MLAVEAINSGANPVLIIINVAISLATGFGWFVLHKLDKENENRRDDIKELFGMSANLKQELADHRLGCTRDFVTHNSMDKFKDECVAKIDRIEQKIDVKFDALQDLILSQLSNRARP
jgi:hypothetical protein